MGGEGWLVIYVHVIRNVLKQGHKNPPSQTHEGIHADITLSANVICYINFLCRNQRSVVEADPANQQPSRTKGAYQHNDLVSWARTPVTRFDYNEF